MSQPKYVKPTESAEHLAQRLTELRAQQRGPHWSYRNESLIRTLEQQLAQARAAYPTESELAPLQGTSKQVAWANDIRARAISTILPIWFAPKMPAIVRNAVLEGVNAFTTARWWIDHLYCASRIDVDAGAEALILAAVNSALERANKTEKIGQ